MAEHSVAALLVVTGICLLAAIRHLSNGLWRPFDRANVLFGFMCCCATGMAWTLSQLYRAGTVDEFTSLLKWNVGYSQAFFLFMPWFTAAVTGQQSRRWLLAGTAAMLMLFVLNLVMPHGVQMAEILRIEQKPLWGDERVAHPVGRLAPTFWFAISAVLLALLHAVVRFWMSWRRERSMTSVLMALAATLFLLASIEGILVRAQLIDFIHLGPIGFFLMVIAMSLTLSYRSHHTLLASEQRFRALVEQSPFGLRVLDRNRTTLQVNPAWLRLWGAQDSALHREIEPRLLPFVDRAFHGHQSETGALVSQDRWIRSFVYPIKDPEGVVRHVIVVHEDVTQARRAEDAARAATTELRQVTRAVLQQERLRALGQMAGGIAHDINNAISPASMYVEALLEQQALDARSREKLGVVQQAISAVVQTVSRLREFSRPRDAQRARDTVDLNQVVEQAVALTRARWESMSRQKGIAIRAELDLSAEPPRIKGIDSEIRDAVVNLIFNAADAMPQGGTITLQTRLLREGALIEVRDTGTGMNEETRRRCLEPFYSTKGEHGSGLGLAMAYGMLKRHGGDIEIVSEVGRGTTVRLRFPLDGEVRRASTENAAAMPGLPLHARVLIADDDPLLLESLRGALEADGYTVMTAEDGQSAIDAFEAAQNAGAPFAAVITDFGMPMVDGRQLSTAVNQMRPATPVIMLTAWAHQFDQNDDSLPHVDQILAKPANLAELRAMLESLLRDSAGRRKDA
jgi:PAS domain S-box-containing protein